MEFMKRNGKRVVLEGLGWLLIVAGLAALLLPGPGLLALFAGLALLATQYEWAERRLVPVRSAALKGAADTVRSWPNILFSASLAVGILALGIVWGLQPDVPAWWPIADKWWLAGGWGTGATLIASGLLAMGTIAYSYTHFRNTKSGLKHKQ